MSFANFEDLHPQESDTDSGDTSDRAAEEEQNEQSHKNVVNREYFGCLNKHPVDRLEDVNAILVS